MKRHRLARVWEWSRTRVRGFIGTASREAERARQLRIARITASDLFDEAFYVEANPAASGTDPVTHYVDHGSAAGLRPNPWFDPEFYRSENPDVADEALYHYLRVGRAQRRLPCAEWTDSLSERRATALGLDREPGPARVVFGIVTYNNAAREVERCLHSIALACAELPAQVSAQVLMLDNGAPTSVARPNADLRRLPPLGNVGFGAGHNLLMQTAFADAVPADFYIAVNPDGVFEPEAVKALLAMSQAAEGRAIVEASQFPVEHAKDYDPATFDTPWASGACMMLPRCVYEAIGGFDPNFFMYCEDVDLSWRARVAGFRVKTCPRALFFHPTANREFDLAIHGRCLVAGITLARLWGGVAFEKRLRQDAKELAINLPRIDAARDPARIAGFADFEYKLHLAPVRWGE